MKYGDEDRRKALKNCHSGSCSIFQQPGKITEKCHQHISNESVAMTLKLIGTTKHGNFVTIINTICKN